MNRSRFVASMVRTTMLLSLWATSAASAQVETPVASSQPVTTEEPVDAGSPRATMSAYLGLCRSGKFIDAARYLDLPKTRMGQGPDLARRLKAVLDRNVWVDLEVISPVEAGNLGDGLPGYLEQIAQFRGPSGQLETVRLIRRNPAGDGPSWVFSRNTVEHVDGWYQNLDQRWALEHLPLWSQRPGPKELLVWQWIALLPLIVVSWLLGALFSNVTRRIFARLAARTKNVWDDALVTRLGGPTTLLWTLALLYWALPELGLYQPAKEFLLGLLRGGFYFAGFWIVSRLIEVWGKIVNESRWSAEHLAFRSLIPVLVRLGKIAILVVAVVALVSSMGYPAASLLAGLGVGGLAIALAAQKTVENLFGAFSLGFDQPFRVGDFVKIEDFVGTVESIGLRSTKIRTLDRTLITIANGKLSEMRIESFSARERIRLACTLGLVYNTTADQMKRVLGGLEDVLRGHPKIWPDVVVVRFKEFGDSALEIEVMAWFLTTDFGEFQRIREEVLLSFMQVVQDAGTSFAFPTRTIHIVQSSVEPSIAPTRPT